MLKRKLFRALLVFYYILLFGGYASNSYAQENSKSSLASVKQKDLGALNPAEALEYMKKTKNLIIVDVAAENWYKKEHIQGAISIPIENLNSDEEDALYMKISKNHPVILHCRRGMIVPRAYRRLKELRPDIPEISYIDGEPPIAEFNKWLSSQ